MTQAAQTTTTTPTTTTSGQAPVQRKDEGKSQGGGGAAAVRGQLRGMSFDEGAAALAPIQMKADGPGGGGTTTTTPPTTTTASGSGESESAETEGHEEPAVVDKGTHDAGAHSSMHGFLGAVAQMPEELLSGGKTVKLALEGQITTAWILKLGLKIELEISKKKEGGFETAAKFHVGIGVGLEVGAEAIAKAEFMAGLCGDYNLKASGDSFGECCRLMWLSVETSMRQAAMAHKAEAPAEAAANKTSAIGKAWAWFRTAVLNMAQDVKSWSLGQIIGAIWGSDQDYEARKAQAVAEMDADDSAEAEALLGVEAKMGVGGDAIGAGVEVEGQGGRGSKTTLSRGDDGQMKTEREKGEKTKIGVTVDTKLGKVKGEIEEWLPESGKAEGELVVECKGGVANWIKGGATMVLGIINVIRAKAGSKALKSFGANLAGDAAAIIIHSLHEHAEHAAHGAAEGTAEKLLEGAVEAGFEFKFKCAGGEWSLEAVELINEAELGLNLHAAKLKGSVVVKQSVYHAHEDH